MVSEVTSDNFNLMISDKTVKVRRILWFIFL